MTPWSRASLAALIWISGAYSVAAQAMDPTARRDVEDVLQWHPHEDEETAKVAQPGALLPYFVFGATYSTNAASSRSDPFQASYATPALGLEIAPAQVLGWSFGAGAKIDGDLYAYDRGEDLGEERVEGYIYASRPLGAGTLTVESVGLAARTDDFADPLYELAIVSLVYDLSLRGADLTVSFDREGSDLPELRRSRFSLIVSRELSTALWNHTVAIKGEMRFSDFSGGANRGRNDTLSALVLTAERPLSPDCTLEWRAALLRRFSNRHEAEFEALDLGLEITRRF